MVNVIGERIMGPNNETSLERATRVLADLDVAQATIRGKRFELQGMTRELLVGCGVGKTAAERFNFDNCNYSIVGGALHVSKVSFLSQFAGEDGTGERMDKVLIAAGIPVQVSAEGTALSFSLRLPVTKTENVLTGDDCFEAGEVDVPGQVAGVLDGDNFERGRD